MEISFVEIIKKMKNKLKTEYTGDWYLPGLIEFAAPGRLIVDNETGSIILTMISKNQLNGEPVNLDLSEDRLKTNLILGEIYGFEQSITLYSPSISTIYDQEFGSSYQFTFHSEFVFLGVLFEEVNDIKFKSMNFKLSHLDAFFNFNAIRKTENNYDFDKTVFLPEFVQDDFHINISGEHRVYLKGNEYMVDGRPFLQIKAEQNRLLDDFLELVSELRSFFHFALAEPVRIIACEIFDPERGDMQVHYGPWIRDSKIYSNPECRSMWRSSKFTNDRIIGFIHEWFELNKSFNHSISLFLYAIKDLWQSGSRSFHYNGLTNALLNMTQAIERMYKDDPIKIEALDTQKVQRVHEFDIIREKIRKSDIDLNEEQLRLLFSRLRITNSEKDINFFPLKKIIEEYCSEHKTILAGYIDEVDFNKFATDLRNIRDDLSHAYNSGEVESKFDKGEFSKIFNKTQLLFYAILHKKLGFKDSEIQEIISNLKLLAFGIK